MSDVPNGPRPTVRTALDADLDDLVRLDGLARAHANSQRGGDLLLRKEIRVEPARESLASEMRDPDTAVRLAVIGELVIGYGVVRLEALSDDSTLAVVDELFIEAAFRGVGAGYLLMDELVRWAESRGAIGIDARALPGDRATKNFFESFGLVARSIAVFRPLGAAAPPDAGNDG